MDDPCLPCFHKAPVFTPTLEDFDDPIKYVHKIFKNAVDYGICKIKPPEYWKPPFAINDTKFAFIPQIQKFSDISTANLKKKKFLKSLLNFWGLQNEVFLTPFIGGKQLDIYELYNAVKEKNGFNNVCHEDSWMDICRKLGFDTHPAIASAVCEKYRKVIMPFEICQNEKTNTDLTSTDDCSQNSKALIKSSNFFACKKCNKSSKPDQMLLCDECCCEGLYHTFCLDNPISHTPAKWLCPKCFTSKFNKKYESNDYGPRESDFSYTLRNFSNMADDYKANYFKRPLTLITLADVRDEFWRLIKDGDCDITVEYGADICSSKTASGFPTTQGTGKKFDYCNSPWNLNNLANNPLSALSYISKGISSMKVPRCNVGMVFSCFPWHTQDHWSFSINYLHTGEPKTWYGVPGASADVVEVVMQDEAPELFSYSPDLLHRMTTFLPPHRLVLRGVPVYHLDQLPGEFVITFPRAYHAGYNNGFNFAEVVNFCPAEWFVFGLNCANHYALLHRPPVFSHAELLCRLTESGVASGRVPITLLLVATDQLRDLLSKERALRRHLMRLGVRRTERFIFEARDGEARRCQLCKTTLFTSALTCSCFKSLLCLEHYQYCVCCPVDDQILLYRYGLDELSQFVERPQARVREYLEWKARVDDFLFAKKSLNSTSCPSHGQIEIDGKIDGSNTEANLDVHKSKQKIDLQELTKLWETGCKNCYPDDLVSPLGEVIKIAADCASTIDKLCSQKPEDQKRSSTASSTPRKHTSPRKTCGNFAELDLPWKPSITKITMSEFEQYMEKVDGLPCTIPKTEELNRLKQRLLKWHTSARELLSLAEQPVTGGHWGSSPRLPEFNQVEPLVAFARSVDVELCNLKSLQHLLECISWLERVERAVDATPTSKETYLTLKELIDLDARGQMLAYVLHPDHASELSLKVDNSITNVESALANGNARLQKVICEAQLLETAIKRVIEAPNGSCELTEAEALVAQASCLKATLNVSEELAHLCAKAHALLDHFSCFRRLLTTTALESRNGTAAGELQKLEVERKIETDNTFPSEFTRRLKLYTADSIPRVWLRFYEEVCSAAKRLPFVFPDTRELKNLLVAVDRCYASIKEVFLPSDDEQMSDPALLLEVLLPRPKTAYELLIQRDAKVVPCGSGGGAADPTSFDARAYVDACKENVSKFLQELNGGSDFDHMYDTVYTPMIENELKLLHYLRRSNMRKSKESDQDAVIYCVCRQPGYTGIMLQCELCKDWFHKRCVGFSSKNVDVRRVRYTCPRCERSLRPELSVVISILEDLVPHVTGTMAKHSSETTMASSKRSPADNSSISSDLMAPLVTVPLLLKLPTLAAVQMLCERAFALVRRVRTVVLSTPELRRAFMEYEAFSGVHMQWNNFNETAMLRAPERQQQRPGSSMSIPSHHSEQQQQQQQQRPVGLTYSHLPPNVVRPPGMQPLVLRTTVPRSLASERLLHFHRQNRFGDPTAPPFNLPRHLQRFTPPSRRESSESISEFDDRDDYVSMRSHPARNSKNPKKHNEKEAAVALAIMSSSTANPPFPSSHFPLRQPRHRTFSGEAGHHQLHPQRGGSMSRVEFRCYVPPDARNWLDTLIGEACALEVSLPQIRWLWQLSLAADPDYTGALHPRIAYEDEMALRRREDRRLSIGEGVGMHRRSRSCRYNSFEKPFYVTLAHKGKESAFCLDNSESYGDRFVPKRKMSQRRRNKPPSHSSCLESRRHSLFKSSWESKRQSEALFGEEEEEEGEDDEEDEGSDSPTETKNDSVESRESSRPPKKPRRESLGGVKGKPVYSVTSISSAASSVISCRDKRAIGAAQRELTASQRYAAAAAVRRASTLASTRRGGTMRRGISRHLQRPLMLQKQSVKNNEVGEVDNDEWEEVCNASSGCRRPRGTIAWVACDKCNYWYHQRCVGIMSALEVPEIYICQVCQVGEHTKGRWGMSVSSASSSSSHSRNSRQSWRLSAKTERQRMKHVGSPSSSSGVEAAQSQDLADDSSIPPKRSRLVSPGAKLGPSADALEETTLINLHSSEGTGAEALLQAIAVLEAQPSTDRMLFKEPDATHSMKPDI